MTLRLGHKRHWVLPPAYSVESLQWKPAALSWDLQTACGEACVPRNKLSQPTRNQSLWTTERWKQSWSRKRFVQCLEKMLWLIKCLRSGLQSFVLEIFCWRMLLCSQIDQLKLIAQSNQDINWEQSTYRKVDILSWHPQNIQIECWKSFTLACLCSFLWCLVST